MPPPGLGLPGSADHPTSVAEAGGWGRVPSVAGPAASRPGASLASPTECLGPYELMPEHMCALVFCFCFTHVCACAWWLPGGSDQLDGLRNTMAWVKRRAPRGTV